jgi:hypothetical protein
VSATQSQSTDAQPAARAKCKVCRKRLPAERAALGLKTCSGPCQQRLKKWHDPRSRAIVKALREVDGEPLWNDRALRQRLGDVSREEASRRLLELAQAKNLLVCPDPRYDGGVSFVGARRRHGAERSPH